jgi:hypothetical protein
MHALAMAPAKKKTTPEDVVPKSALRTAVDPAIRFAHDSIRLVQKCTKPDAKGQHFRVSEFAFQCAFDVMH